MKINQIWKKINSFKIYTKKQVDFPSKKDLDLFISLIWRLDVLKEAKHNHEEIIVDPLIDKLISKINSLMSNYC